MDVTGMEGKASVSIVIPCFNHGRFLAEAIESARRQTWRPIEIVVVDDGSRDDSATVAARCTGVRLVSQTNQGLAAARNTGLRASRGEFVIFLDADDRLLPEAAEAGVARLQSHPSAAFALGRCSLIDEFGRPLATNLPHITGAYYRELLASNYIWMPAMAMFRRSVFDAVGGFDPRVSPSADYDLYLRITRQFEIAPHGALVAEYRRHSANMSADPVLMLRTTLSVLRRQRRYACCSPHDRAAYKEGLLHWRRLYGEHLVERFRAELHRRGHRLAAMKDAARLLRLYPRGVAFHMRKKLALSFRGIIRIAAL
jgi:glycosyltransferase involved in cell wall biosynthesis